MKNKRILIRFFLFSAFITCRSVYPSDLAWYKHKDAKIGDSAWSNNGMESIVSANGSKWREFSQVIADDEGVFYAIKGDGSLVWYRHLGSEDGSYNWVDGGRERTVSLGNGWKDFKHIFSGGNGVIYAIKEDGSLVWYKNEGISDGSAIWVNNGLEKNISNETDWAEYLQVLGGREGVIYAVTADGRLLWFKHNGFDDGENSWENGGKGSQVSTGYGWGDYKRIVYGGDGVIYAVRSDGKLAWYNHVGFTAGTQSWANQGLETIVSADFSYWHEYKQVLGSDHGVLYAILAEPRENHAPEFTSESSLSVVEGATVVTLLTAFDPDGDELLFSLSGGLDKSAFTVNSRGELAFLDSPRFDAPHDSNLDNVYEIQVTVSDGMGGLESLNMEVSVLRGSGSDSTQVAGESGGGLLDIFAFLALLLTPVLRMAGNLAAGFAVKFVT